MEAIRQTVRAQEPSLSRRWKAAGVALSLVAAVWAGFSVGRASAPSLAGARANAAAQQRVVDWPIVLPTGAPGRVWGHWDSARVRVRAASAPRMGAVGHARPHHRVKWGN
jgi:hypothetical protein